MKILVGFCDIDYPAVRLFEEFGTCTFSRYNKTFLLQNISEYHVLVPHLFEDITADILSVAPNLKVVATPTTGTDHIDLLALRETSVKLISLNDDPEFINNISSTAEMNFLLLLACARKFRSLLDRVLIDESWVNTDIRGHEVQGKTLGIIGYGRLGKMMSRYGKAFGMHVCAYDINLGQFDGMVESVDLEELFARSDFISLNAKLNSSSRHIINHSSIANMKTGVSIINAARGALIDSKAVIDGLDSGKISAIGLDVCNDEYQSARLPADPLINRSLVDPRIVITPHAGGSTYDAHAKVFGRISELTREFLNVSGLLK